MEELLLKYIKGNCTDEERVIITKWLDSDPQNMKEYLALRKLNAILIWQTDPHTAHQEKSKGRISVRQGNRYYIEAIKIAAIFVLAVLVSRYLVPDQMQNKTIPVMQTIHVPAGQRAEITLEDGTRVWLNANTTLAFPNQFSGNTREVKLAGEGFFNVTSDKLKPFIVSTAKYDVKVWGTKFNLMAYSDAGTFETSLLEGAIEILKQGRSTGIMLKPDEQAYSRDGKMVIAPIRNRGHFLWTEGILSFDDTPFPELVNQLELYFDLDIEIKNNQILNYRCTGKFRTKDGVEHILKVLQMENAFSYRRDDKLNKLTIE
ncbi:MAG: FecR domain-containing protein [Mangrovibacterium sp.]